jgi:hypothetical protein
MTSARDLDDQHLLWIFVLPSSCKSIVLNEVALMVTILMKLEHARPDDESINGNYLSKEVTILSSTGLVYV